MSVICVYKDDGAVISPVQNLFRDFHNGESGRRKPIALELVDSRQLRGGYLTRNHKDIEAMILPGNRSAGKYIDSLGPYGRKDIVNYTMLGGCFIGICSGAYLAARHAVFKTATTSIVRDFRGSSAGLLGLFHGVCEGPLPLDPLQPWDVRGWNGAVAVPVDLQQGRISLINWGGPVYRPSPDERVTVLAQYGQDSPAPGAIAACMKGYGRGLAMLFGVHFEITAPYLTMSPTARIIDGDQTGQQRIRLAERMAGYEEGHRQFVRHILGLCAEHYSNPNSGFQCRQSKQLPLYPERGRGSKNLVLALAKA